ncbi:MAG: HEAT repeat domain-containing protein [Candidatus Poribacteria bacterium]|nr:HEAT repeat domain-containing protein [Candidatus Poribacteria bacterium]
MPKNDDAYNNTPRLTDPPSIVRGASKTAATQHGTGTYREPFERASILRRYGVRILSALGPHATRALRQLANHGDPLVRASVADELKRHADVESIDTLARIAARDAIPEVQEAARQAVEELRLIAERLAAQQRPSQRAQTPLLETGETDAN